MLQCSVWYLQLQISSSLSNLFIIYNDTKNQIQICFCFCQKFKQNVEIIEMSKKKQRLKVDKQDLNNVKNIWENNITTESV